MENLNYPVDYKYQTTINDILSFSGITLHKGIISNIKIKLVINSNSNLIFNFKNQSSL